MQDLFKKMGSKQAQCIPFFEINPEPTRNDFIVIGNAVGCKERNVRYAFKTWNKNNGILARLNKTLQNVVSDMFFLYKYYTTYYYPKGNHNTIDSNNFVRHNKIVERIKGLMKEVELDEEGNVIPEKD